jgi:hypothetical protein
VTGACLQAEARVYSVLLLNAILGLYFLGLAISRPQVRRQAPRDVHLGPVGHRRLGHAARGRARRGGAWRREPKSQTCCIVFSASLVSAMCHINFVLVNLEGSIELCYRSTDHCNTGSRYNNVIMMMSYMIYQYNTHATGSGETQSGTKSCITALTVKTARPWLGHIENIGVSRLWVSI